MMKRTAAAVATWILLWGIGAHATPNNGSVKNKATGMATQTIEVSDPDFVDVIWVMDPTPNPPAHLNTFFIGCSAMAATVQRAVAAAAPIQVTYQDCQEDANGPATETWDVKDFFSVWSNGERVSASTMADLDLTDPLRVSLGNHVLRFGTGNSATPSLSGDGRFLAFASDAVDLARRDTNGVRDIFHYDRQTNQIVRISAAGATGVQANGSSFSPSIDAAGRLVAFASNASNLVADTNSLLDVYMRDVEFGAFTRVSIGLLGADPNGLSRAPAISGDGGTVVFASDADNLVTGDSNGLRDIFAYDVGTTAITRVSVATGGVQATGGSGSDDPAVSADGRFVVFQSSATNLVSPDNNGTYVFLRDRVGNTTTWVSDNGNGDHLSPRISDDGRFILYSSESDDLVTPDSNGFARDAFLWDRTTSMNAIVSVDSSSVQGNSDSGGFSGGVAISADGTSVAFESAATNLVAGDANGIEDIFIRDLTLTETVLGSTGQYGSQANAATSFVAISADGRRAAYASTASNLLPDDTNGQRDIFVANTRSRTLELVSVGPGGVLGNGPSGGPALSGDGTLVAFDSTANNLVAGDGNNTSDVFVFDRLAGTTERVSVTSGAVEANDMSFSPSLSRDGRYVAFVSYANNLEPGDSNVARDVFLHDRQTGQTEAVSKIDGLQTLGNDESGDMRFLGDGRFVSDDGRFVAFDAIATDLVTGDGNLARDVFVRDRTTNKTILVSEATTGGPGNQESSAPAMTPDGRFVAFISDASNLVVGDNNLSRDVFLADLLDPDNPVIERVSVDSNEVEGNGPSGGFGGLALSDDASLVFFSSEATNLVSGDGNTVADLFVRDRTSGETFRRSLTLAGGEADTSSTAASTTSSGLLVAYESDAGNLLPDDTNGTRDVFVQGPDGDGDGELDQFDAFPADDTETIDTDEDGLGNNVDTDDDGDGLLDAVEVANNLDPLDPTDADQDPDGDGFTSREEIAAGTDPLDPDSFPRALPVPLLGPWGLWLMVSSLLGLGLIGVARRRPEG
jgi:Tol biopolymer transport system component